MHQQAVKSILRTATLRRGVVQAHVKLLQAAPWLRARSFVSRASFSSSRVTCAFTKATSSAGPTPQDNIRQALELGVQLPEQCSGCGVNLQPENPNAPG